MRCFIYRNLNRKGILYSLKAVEGPHKGLVLGYAPGILVMNAQLIVSESGRQRVLKNQRKNVHAGIVGDVVGLYEYQKRFDRNGLNGLHMSGWHDRKFIQETRQITYNPYKYETFVDKTTLQPVHTAQFVSLWYADVRATFA